MKYKKILIFLLLVWFPFFPSVLAATSDTLWADSVESGTNDSCFYSVAVDGSGNIYSSGYIYGNSIFDFGNGVTVSGDFDSGFNLVLVKYDSSGNAQWAKSVVSGSEQSRFWCVTVDDSGNIYASGLITNSSTYDFGNGVTVNGAYFGYNPILVKYDSNGNAQWAKSTTAGSGNSIFYGVAVDSSGNIYTSGSINGTSTYDFGNGVTATGKSSSGSSVILVKYDSSGNSQWAKTVTTSGSSSRFYAVATDGSGNIYAAGDLYGTDAYGFGNGVTVNGAHTDWNTNIVKYDSNGDAAWAKSTTASSDDSRFYSVAVDDSGNIYASGGIYGDDTFGFGNEVTVIGAYGEGENSVLLKYDNNGSAQWAKTVISGSSNSFFEFVAIDHSGNSYASGYINGSGVYDFGNEVTVTGAYASGDNSVIVKYDSSGETQWAKSTTSALSDSNFHSIALDSTGDIYDAYVSGYIKGSDTFNFGNGVTVTGFNDSNVVLVKYEGHPAPNPNVSSGNILKAVKWSTLLGMSAIVILSYS